MYLSVSLLILSFFFPLCFAIDFCWPGTEVECSVLGVSAWELAVGVALMRLETFVSYH